MLPPGILVQTVKVRPTCLRETASLQNGFDLRGSAQILARYLHDSYRPRPPNSGQGIPSILPETVDLRAHNGCSDQIARVIFLQLRILPPQIAFPTIRWAHSLIKV